MKKLTLKNWSKPAKKEISNLANILIILNAGLIPSILALPIPDEIRLWIIAVYNVIASLITTYKKLSKDETIEEVALMDKNSIEPIFPSEK